MNRTQLYRAIAIALAAGSLAACGGGSGSATPSSTTTVGVITGFGSIYVNGVRFDTSNAVYKVDDDDAFDDSALGIGMKVRVKGTRNPDGLTGTAKEIYYDDDLDGPIENLTVIGVDTKSFHIFGQVVIVDSRRTVFDDGLRFDTLANGQEVEVSGYYENGKLIATRVELENGNGDGHEVKGIIRNYTSGGFDLVLPSGTVVPVITYGGTRFDSNLTSGLTDGLYVEVEGIWDGSRFTATYIENEDDLLSDDDHDVEIKGTLSGDAAGGWYVKGIEVIPTSTTRYEPAGLKDIMVAGMEVEVEGFMRGGTLIAKEIEAYENDFDIEAPVLSVSYDPSNPKSGIVTLQFSNGQTLDVITNNATLFKDDSRMDLNGDGSFGLNELALSGEFVEMEAYLGGDGTLIASTISREDNISDTEVEALLEAFTPGVDVTVVGITWTVGPTTRYEIDDRETDYIRFWETTAVGMKIEVEDKAPANGVADKLELDISSNIY